MSAPITIAEKAHVEKPALVCRIRHRLRPKRGYSPIAGEVELKNTSSESLEIVTQMSPLQYLNLIVTDATGNIVSGSHYGNIFSPAARPFTVRIEPGESFVGPISFMGNVPRAKQLPGRYMVQAVFEYEKLRAISEPYFVELPVPS